MNERNHKETEDLRTQPNSKVQTIPTLKRSVESPKKLFVTEKERILRKTTTHEVIERSFTTGRKRKPKTTITIDHSTVKERCRQLTEIALELFPDRRINQKDLAYLVMTHIGGNRDTIRAYIGYRGRKIQNSYGNTKILGTARKGYLELFGFMHPKNLHWIIHAQTTFKQVLEEAINPPLPPLPFDINECHGEKESIKKISLSQSPTISLKNVERGNGGKPGLFTSGCPPSNIEVVRKKRKKDSAREILFSWSKPQYTQNYQKDANLEFLETLAKAKPGEEPDRGHVDWGPQKPIIPKKEGGSSNG